MQVIRVVTAELPRMLNDIIGSVLEADGDIEVVGEASDPSQLNELLRRRHPDVAILGLENSGLTRFGWELFAADPQLRVLGVLGEGRQTYAYELRPHRTPLGELSPEELTAAVRRLADARHAASIGSANGAEGVEA